MSLSDSAHELELLVIGDGLIVDRVGENGHRGGGGGGGSIQRRSDGGDDPAGLMTEAKGRSDDKVAVATVLVIMD